MAKGKAIKISSAMVRTGTRVLRESGRLYAESSADSLVVREILEKALGAHLAVSFTALEILRSVVIAKGKARALRLQRLGAYMRRSALTFDDLSAVRTDPSCLARP